VYTRDSVKERSRAQKSKILESHGRLPYSAADDDDSEN
jgi:hypothetical protein